MNEDLHIKEMDILRKAMDTNEKQNKYKQVNDPEIKKMISIVEDFIISKRLICYGGTAINNILPKNKKFYNKDLDIPDYDFFSYNALNHAKELARKYFSAGYMDVHASAGVHHGTYKVFVNFIPIADITQLPNKLFKSLQQNAIHKSKIYYAPSNYLRMSMYLELSRPNGDVSRWEKVLQRLVLLNDTYPLRVKYCRAKDFQRPLYKHPQKGKHVFNIIKQEFIKHDVIFFGAFATSLYGEYMPKTVRTKLQRIPDFDVLANDPERVATQVVAKLTKEKYLNVHFKKRLGVADVIPEHYEIIIDKDTVAFIYLTTGCHNYNTIQHDGQSIHVATIDTMLSFYLAFIYADRPYYDTHRILCMAQYLFIVQQKNRLAQKGLLKRFVNTCYGHQVGREELRSIKQRKFNELHKRRNSSEYEEWFLKYDPSRHRKTRKRNIKNKKKHTKTKKKN